MDKYFESIMELHDQVFDADRLPVAACAFAIVSIMGTVTGPLGGFANPIFWRVFGFLFGTVGDKLGNIERKYADLVTRGLIVTIMGVVIAFLIGTFFQSLSEHYPNFKIIDIVALSMVLASGAGWHSLLKLYKGMESKTRVKGAFFAVAQTTRTNLTVADEYTITRLGIGMTAKLLDKGIIAPILWYLIGGLPLAYLYAALAALSWRFGKEGFCKGFGIVALNLEKIMGFAPNIFAGLLISFAGILTPTAGMTRSFIGLFGFKKGNSPYFEGGAPVTAMAFALGVSLGGSSQDLDGSAIKRGWAGPEGVTAKLEAKHLHRALYLSVMAHILFLLSILGAILMHGYGFFI